MNETPGLNKRLKYDAVFRAEDLRLAEQGYSTSQHVVGWHVTAAMPEDLVIKTL